MTEGGTLPKQKSFSLLKYKKHNVFLVEVIIITHLIMEEIDTKATDVKVNETQLVPCFYNLPFKVKM